MMTKPTSIAATSAAKVTRSSTPQLAAFAAAFAAAFVAAFVAAFAAATGCEAGRLYFLMQ